MTASRGRIDRVHSIVLIATAFPTVWRVRRSDDGAATNEIAILLGSRSTTTAVGGLSRRFRCLPAQRNSCRGPVATMVMAAFLPPLRPRAVDASPMAASGMGCVSSTFIRRMRRDRPSQHTPLEAVDGAFSSNIQMRELVAKDHCDPSISRTGANFAVQNLTLPDDSAASRASAHRACVGSKAKRPREWHRVRQRPAGKARQCRVTGRPRFCCRPPGGSTTSTAGTRRDVSVLTLTMSPADL